MCWNTALRVGAGLNGRPAATRFLFGVTVVLAGAFAAHAQTIVSDFTGYSLFDPGASSGYVPPDTMGAIGPTLQVGGVTQKLFAEHLNGVCAVYDAYSGAQVSVQSDTSFWSAALANGGSGATLQSGFVLSDPRIAFDAASQRWYSTMITVPSSGLGANQVLVAVSKTANYEDGFNGFAINANPTSGTSSLLDFPMLGINSDAVYVSGNDFNTSGSGTGTSVIVIPKSSLIAATPSLSGEQLFYNQRFGSTFNGGSGTGFTPHAAIDLDGGSATETLLSDYGSKNAPTYTLSTVTKGGNGTYSLQIGTANAVSPFTQPPDAAQPGGPNTIDTGDTRFSGAVIKKGGYFWGVQSISQNSRSALRWVQIDASTGALFASGIIGDAAHDYYYGSVAVSLDASGNGNLVVGYTRSSDTEFASAYASTGAVSGFSVGALDAPILLQAGAASYDQSASGTNRWGDYSATMVDPDNNNVVWTVQEWAKGSGQWSTQIAALQLADATPEPQALSLIAGCGIPLLYLARRRRS